MDSSIIAAIIGGSVTLILAVIAFAYFTGRQTQATEHLRLEVAKLSNEVKENNKELWNEVNEHTKKIVRNESRSKSAHNRLDDLEKRFDNLKGA